MATFFLLVSISCFGLFIYRVFNATKVSGVIQDLAAQSDNLIETLEGFKASSACKLTNGIDLSGFLYVDHDSRKFCIVSTNMSYKIYDPKDIIDISIAENNSTITETKITNQIGRAVVGGALLGGVGAVVGGLTSNKTNTVSVDSLHVVMHLNDFDNHTIMINCLGVKVERNSPAYLNAINVANSWYGVLNVLMHSEIESVDEITQKDETTIPHNEKQETALQAQ